MEVQQTINFNFKVVNKVRNALDLELAEERYKELDLIYQFCRTFRHSH